MKKIIWAARHTEQKRKHVEIHGEALNENLLKKRHIKKLPNYLLIKLMYYIQSDIKNLIMIQKSMK